MKHPLLPISSDNFGSHSSTIDCRVTLEYKLLLAPSTKHILDSANRTKQNQPQPIRHTHTHTHTHTRAREYTVVVPRHHQLTRAEIMSTRVPKTRAAHGARGWQGAPTPTPQLPTVKQIDGISFLGGGVRCPTHQLPPLCLAMYRLGLTPEELLHGVKYMSCNSGGAFTLSAVLCYPLCGDAFPLDKIKDMIQETR